MTMMEIVIALAIYFIIPLTGLLFFLQLKKRMKRENVQNRPTVELFIIFATYGGLILVVLIELFWYWSGMASLGIFYLIFGAPIVMGIIAYRHRHTRTISKYHKWTYILGVAYFIVPVLIFILFLVTLFLMGDKIKH